VEGIETRTRLPEKGEGMARKEGNSTVEGSHSSSDTDARNRKITSQEDGKREKK
jgi:hypothetical protein